MALVPAQQRQHAALEKEEEAEPRGRRQDPCLLLLHRTRAASGIALGSSWQAQLCELVAAANLGLPGTTRVGLSLLQVSDSPEQHNQISDQETEQPNSG